MQVTLLRGYGILKTSRLICLIIFLLMLPVAVLAGEQGNHICQDYKCYAAWGFSMGDAFGFGIKGSGTPSSGPTGDGIQLETGDFLLTEDGKYLIQE